jgi:hypothetical protein
VRIAHAEFGDAAVARDGGERVAQEAFDIDLTHQVVDHGSAARVHQVEDGLDFVLDGGRAALQPIDLGDSLAFVGGVDFEARHGGEAIVRRAHFGQVLLHFEGDFAAGGGSARRSLIWPPASAQPGRRMPRLVAARS